jgi:hypothetical protein
MELFIPNPSVDNNSRANKLIQSLLSACHQLDHTICSLTQRTPHEISEWHALDPFAYLTSPALISRWEEDLGILCQDYLEGKFIPETFEKRLEAILPGVEKLEVARDRCRNELVDEIERMGVGVEVPAAFWEGVDRRCTVIDEVFGRLDRVLDRE